MCLNHFEHDRNLVLSPLGNFRLLTELPNQLPYCLPDYFLHRRVPSHPLNHGLYPGAHRPQPLLPTALYRFHHASYADQHHRHCLPSQGPIGLAHHLQRVKAGCHEREGLGVTGLPPPSQDGEQRGGGQGEEVAVEGVREGGRRAVAGEEVLEGEQDLGREL